MNKRRRWEIALTAFALLIAGVLLAWRPVGRLQADHAYRQEVAARNAAYDAEHPRSGDLLAVMPESRPEDFTAAADCYPHAGVVDKARCAESTAEAERAEAKAKVEATARSTAEWERDLAAFKAEKAAEPAKAAALNGRP